MNKTSFLRCAEKRFIRQNILGRTYNLPTLLAYLLTAYLPTYLLQIELKFCLMNLSGDVIIIQ
jgi:hypothetical protein